MGCTNCKFYRVYAKVGAGYGVCNKHKIRSKVLGHLNKENCKDWQKRENEDVKDVSYEETKNWPMEADIKHKIFL